MLKLQTATVSVSLLKGKQHHEIIKPIINMSH